MNIDYKGGEIELRTETSCAAFVAIRVNVNYQCLNFTEFRMVSKSKYIFFDKSSDQYAKDIDLATNELTDYGKKIIDGLVKLSGE